MSYVTVGLGSCFTKPMPRAALCRLWLHGSAWKIFSYSPLQAERTGPSLLLDAPFNVIFSCDLRSASEQSLDLILVDQMLEASRKAIG